MGLKKNERKRVIAVTGVTTKEVLNKRLNKSHPSTVFFTENSSYHGDIIKGDTIYTYISDIDYTMNTVSDDAAVVAITRNDDTHLLELTRAWVEDSNHNEVREIQFDTYVNRKNFGDVYGINNKVDGMPLRRTVQFTAVIDRPNYVAEGTTYEWYVDDVSIGCIEDHRINTRTDNPTINLSCRANRGGSFNLICKLKNRGTEYSVKVKVNAVRSTIQAESIEILPSKLSLAECNKFKMEARLTPANSTRIVKWEIIPRNSRIASIDDHGVVTTYLANDNPVTIRAYTSEENGTVIPYETSAQCNLTVRKREIDDIVFNLVGTQSTIARQNAVESAIKTTFVYPNVYPPAVKDYLIQNRLGHLTWNVDDPNGIVKVTPYSNPNELSYYKIESKNTVGSVMVSAEMRYPETNSGTIVKTSYYSVMVVNSIATITDMEIVPTSYTLGVNKSNEIILLDNTVSMNSENTGYVNITLTPSNVNHLLSVAGNYNCYVDIDSVTSDESADKTTLVYKITSHDDIPKGTVDVVSFTTTDSSNLTKSVAVNYDSPLMFPQMLIETYFTDGDSQNAKVTTLSTNEPSSVYANVVVNADGVNAMPPSFTYSFTFADRFNFSQPEATRDGEKWKVMIPIMAKDGSDGYIADGTSLTFKATLDNVNYVSTTITVENSKTDIAGISLNYLSESFVECSEHNLDVVTTPSVVTGAIYEWSTNKPRLIDFGNSKVGPMKVKYSDRTSAVITVTATTNRDTEYERSVTASREITILPISIRTSNSMTLVNSDLTKTQTVTVTTNKKIEDFKSEISVKMNGINGTLGADTIGITCNQLDNYSAQYTFALNHSVEEELFGYYIVSFIYKIDESKFAEYNIDEDDYVERSGSCMLTIASGITQAATLTSLVADPKYVVDGDSNYKSTITGTFPISGVNSVSNFGFLDSKSLLEFGEPKLVNSKVEVVAWAGQHNIQNTQETTISYTTDGGETVQTSSATISVYPKVTAEDTFTLTPPIAYAYINFVLDSDYDPRFRIVGTKDPMTVSYFTTDNIGITWFEQAGACQGKYGAITSAYALINGSRNTNEVILRTAYHVTEISGVDLVYLARGTEVEATEIITDYGTYTQYDNYINKAVDAVNSTYIKRSGSKLLATDNVANGNTVKLFSVDNPNATWDIKLWSREITTLDYENTIYVFAGEMPVAINMSLTGYNLDAEYLKTLFTGVDLSGFGSVAGCTVTQDDEDVWHVVLKVNIDNFTQEVRHTFSYPRTAFYGGDGHSNDAVSNNLSIKFIPVTATGEFSMRYTTTYAGRLTLLCIPFTADMSEKDAEWFDTHIRVRRYVYRKIANNTLLSLNKGDAENLGAVRLYHAPDSSIYSADIRHSETLYYSSTAGSLVNGKNVFIAIDESKFLVESDKFVIDIINNSNDILDGNSFTFDVDEPMTTNTIDLDFTLSLNGNGNITLKSNKMFIDGDMYYNAVSNNYAFKTYTEDYLMTADLYVNLNLYASEYATGSVGAIRINISTWLNLLRNSNPAQSAPLSFAGQTFAGRLSRGGTTLTWTPTTMDFRNAFNNLNFPSNSMYIKSWAFQYVKGGMSDKCLLYVPNQSNGNVRYKVQQRGKTITF